MSKLIGLGLAASLLLPSADPVPERFTKYKIIEAYEVRPGLLMMPRYSSDGRVCEIGLEALHYSSEKIRLDSSLSRNEIDQVFDELVPADDRGPKTKDPLGTLIIQGGQSLATNIDYENVVIQIYGTPSPAIDRGGTTVDEVAATLKWKNRKCK